MRTMSIALVATLAVVGCRKDPGTKDQPREEQVKTAEGKEVSLTVDRGVDVGTKTITLGVLNDESGPAAAIGKPFAEGKRILVAQTNAGHGPLPEGWKVKLVEKDHGYNPQKSVQAYKEIRDDVLFLATSFGTPPTLPLRKDLERDEIVAFPASFSSQMAEHAYTPPAGASYVLEAKRAMDWAVEKLGGAANVKAGIVYNQDDYGKDGLDGWEAQAKIHGVEIVDRQAATPGQKDFTATITSLEEKGANVVLLTVLPSATGPLLGTGAKMQYGPLWIGNTPAWLDVFFSPKVIPPAVFTNFFWVTSLPYWGEDVPGMATFTKAFDEHASEGARKDFYTLVSYTQGRIALEAARRALDAGDITRAGYLKALQAMKGVGVMGLDVDFSSVPYVTGTRTRILKAVMDKGTWELVAPYAEPKKG